MSRPGRSILICDGNPVTVSILRYVLEVRRGALVTEASCAYDAMEAMRYLPVHVLLTNSVLYGSGSDELTKRVKTSFPETKVIVYGEDRRLWKRRPETTADALFIGSLAHLGPLLEQVRILGQRKRGPKKGHAPYVARRRQAA